MAMSEGQKRANFMHCKAQFVKMSKTVGDPCSYPTELPQDPVAFKASHPGLWVARFCAKILTSPSATPASEELPSRGADNPIVRTLGREVLG
jgi:hypothetical protein